MHGAPAVGDVVALTGGHHPSFTGAAVIALAGAGIAAATLRTRRTGGEPATSDSGTTDAVTVSA